MTPLEVKVLTFMLAAIAAVAFGCLLGLVAAYDRIRQLEEGRALRGDVVEIVEEKLYAVRSRLGHHWGCLISARSRAEDLANTRPDREEVVGLIARAFGIAAESLRVLDAEDLAGDDPADDQVEELPGADAGGVGPCDVTGCGGAAAGCDAAPFPASFTLTLSPPFGTGSITLTREETGDRYRSVEPSREVGFEPFGSRP